jgi:hypothetical protein
MSHNVLPKNRPKNQLVLITSEKVDNKFINHKIYSTYSCQQCIQWIRPMPTWSCDLAVSCSVIWMKWSRDQVLTCSYMRDPDCSSWQTKCQGVGYAYTHPSFPRILCTWKLVNPLQSYHILQTSFSFCQRAHKLAQNHMRSRGFPGQENHSCDISTKKSHSCGFLIVPLIFKLQN